MEIVTIIAPFALAFIMLGLGLGLTVQDFLRVIKVPKDFLIGFICQLILLPLVAFGLIKLLNTSSELAIGVILIAAAPGGVTSNVFTKFANGDVALSISLTAIISSMDFFEIDIQKEVSMIGISLKMFLVVTMPVIIGMLIRHFAKEFVISQALLIQRISVILFVLVFTAIYMEEWDNIISYFVDAGLIALTLNIIMMIIGFYVAKFFVSGVAQQKCISIECGLQNGTLAVFVGTQIFNENVSIYIAPTAAYALIMMISSIFFVFIIKKNT
jgi:BASS family bile acid:Na+ symporter